MSADTFLSSLEYSFQKLAGELGWPEEVYTRVHIEADSSGNLSFSYDGDIAEQVHDLEYGKFEQPARPAMRNFKGREAKAIKAVASAVAMSEAGLI